MNAIGSTTQWRGVALALLVAVSFAANSTFAAVAYAGGSNALTMFAVRSTAAFCILLFVLFVRSQPIALPRTERRLAFMLGFVMAGASYGILGAMELMPVALVIITLYTYPFIVAIVGWVSGREAFEMRFALALFGAFIGLVLALDIVGNAPNAFGLLLAVSGALGVAMLLIVNERHHGGRSSLAFTLHMLGTCMVVSILAGLYMGDFALPTSTVGWLGFIGTPLCYSFSIIFMFVAVAMIGSVRTSMFMNIEPVSSVVLGFLLLSQSLGPLQLGGIAIVVAAIMSMTGTAKAIPAKDAP